MRCATLCLVLAGALARTRPSEYIARKKGAKTRGCLGECSAEPHLGEAPTQFTWAGHLTDDQPSMLTAVLNQHIPQYCGSCWAFATLSAFGDRIKLARGGKGAEIQLSIQHVLNCGWAGSCYGGNPLAVYEWIMENGHVAYASANPYLACSSDSTEGFCGHVDTTCKDINVARSCDTFLDNGGSCTALTQYPNATIKEYGTVETEHKIKAEIQARGPVACGVAATDALDNYNGGILDEDPDDGQENEMINHVVSIVGWGEDKGIPYWTVRNSWGEHWGEMGFFRVKRGNNSFMIESECVYAVPGEFTVKNFACHENSGNCGNSKVCKGKSCGHGASLARDEGFQARSRKQVASRSLDANATAP